ncbi:hypothetical protein [Vibrio scophthalmi]|uniref:Uncharacterized protein n=1 Tax=Vibrio scophthalmi LMG 19158 TaxID=870967 RepID=F9RI90_9VIBR|nr:hypothetical protein [Vibrio scophthalmi]EGU42422.1 hypothetical protein VIS19158_11513 [Vibrio scophthalmi LMG 19158]
MTTSHEHSNSSHFIILNEDVDKNAHRFSTKRKVLFGREVFHQLCVNPTYSSELNRFLNSTLESSNFRPNKITLYSYRATAPHHVLNFDSQFEITITEGNTSIPDLWNFQDGVRTGNVDISVYDSVDVLYLIETIIAYCRQHNPELQVERTK